MFINPNTDILVARGCAKGCANGSVIICNIRLNKLTTTILLVRSTLKHILFTKSRQCINIFSCCNYGMTFDRSRRRKCPTRSTVTLIWCKSNLFMIIPVNCCGKVGDFILLKIGWFLQYSQV